MSGALLLQGDNTLEDALAKLDREITKAQQYHMQPVTPIRVGVSKGGRIPNHMTSTVDIVPPERNCDWQGRVWRYTAAVRVRVV